MVYSIVIITASLADRVSAEASRHLNNIASCAYVVDFGEQVPGSVALGVVLPGPVRVLVLCAQGAQGRAPGEAEGREQAEHLEATRLGENHQHARCNRSQ